LVVVLKQFEQNMLMKGIEIHCVAERDSIAFDEPAIGLIVLGSILEYFLMHGDKSCIIEVEVVLLHFGLDSIQNIPVLDKGQILF
jgi:hypothetical protein